MRILIVEDEQFLGEAVRDGLIAEGFDAELVADGQAGIDRAGDGSFDAIVLDVLLPKRNGFEVCSELRRMGVATPILMLTAKDGELDEAEALDTGADDFLRKPFSFVVLIARLNALLRRNQRSRPHVLEAGDLVLDPASYRVRRGEANIELTQREFALLAALMGVVGETVAKEALLSQVWGDGFEGDPNIVEVYVGYLRKKIDQPFDRHSLQTVRGVGYRLDPTSE
jgi:two-component system, OmpR family, response regulator